MYLHRPDSVSLAFGVLFTVIGILFMTGIQAWLHIGLLIGLLGLAAGIGVIGSLVFGDVHKRAAQRLAARGACRPQPVGPTGPPAVSPWDLDSFQKAETNDPVFGHPIDPDALDQAYRETFGDTDPLKQSRPIQDDSGS